MLIVKLFQLAIALAAYNNFKIKQFNIIIAFLNAILYRKYIYYQLLNRFKKLKKCIKLYNAFYKLRNALLF